MTLHAIISKAIKFQLGGIKATYRRANSPLGTTLLVYPLAFSAETVETVGGQARTRFSRVDVLWVETDDLHFNGEPFLPERGDEITFRLGDELHRHIVDSHFKDASDESLTVIKIFTERGGRA